MLINIQMQLRIVLKKNVCKHQDLLIKLWKTNDVVSALRILIISSQRRSMTCCLIDCELKMLHLTFVIENILLLTDAAAEE